jgi:hypothetical protein
MAKAAAANRHDAWEIRIPRSARDDEAREDARREYSAAESGIPRSARDDEAREDARFVT